MTKLKRFLGGGERNDSSLLDYEQTLGALRAHVRSGRTIHLGRCAVTILMHGELSEALGRG